MAKVAATGVLDLLCVLGANVAMRRREDPPLHRSEAFLSQAYSL